MFGAFAARSPLRGQSTRLVASTAPRIGVAVGFDRTAASHGARRCVRLSNAELSADVFGFQVVVGELTSEVNPARVFLVFFRARFHGRFSQFNVVEQTGQGTAILLQSGFIDFCFVSDASLPTLPNDPLPFVSQRAHGRVMTAPLGSLLSVVRRRPATVCRIDCWAYSWKL